MCSESKTCLKKGLAVSCILFVCLSSQSVRSQEEAVKAELLTLAFSGVVRDLNFATTEGVSNVTVYSRGFGVPTAYEGPREIVFFRPLPNPAGIENQEREIVARATLPGGGRYLLLFEKSVEGSAVPYQVTVVDNDLVDFPPGAYRILNLSSRYLAGSFGSNRFRIQAEERSVVTAQGDENGNVEVRFFALAANSSEMIYSSVWQVKDTRRTTVFLLGDSSQKQQLEVRKFVEPIVPGN